MPPISAPAERLGIVYAMTAEGYQLPVIDVTNPCFGVADDPEAVDALRDAFIESERRRNRVPKFLMDLFLWSAARRSLLVRALLRPEAAFLGGLSTYVMKLGVNNLRPPFSSKIDQQLVASPAATSMRVRLQQTARLMAEGLEQDLVERPGAPLHLINIGGGPAIDSLNALILLKNVHPDVLARPVTIHVLDVDAGGPFFGANALAALAADDGPLAGLHISLKHETYSWTNTGVLERLIGDLSAQGTIVAASSEGALFEYASDDAVIANLKALRSSGRGVALVAGSVTRADKITHQMIASSRFKLVPRGIDGFAPLAARAGFTIAHVESALVSDQVLLRAKLNGKRRLEPTIAVKLRASAGVSS